MSPVDISRAKTRDSCPNFEDALPLPRTQGRSIAPPSERNAIVLGASDDIGQVKFKNIVAFNRIGVACVDHFVEVAKQICLTHIRSTQHGFKTPRIGNRDENDLCIGCLGIEREGLDIELQAVEITVAHLSKEGLARKRQMLPHGIAKIKMRYAILCETVTCIEKMRPTVKVYPRAKLAASF